MKTSSEEVRIKKTKREKGKGGSRKKKRRKEEGKETEKRKNSRNQESSRGVGDLG